MGRCEKAFQRVAVEPCFLDQRGQRHETPAERCNIFCAEPILNALRAGVRALQ